jgi:hypothetical protein
MPEPLPSISLSTDDQKENEMNMKKSLRILAAVLVLVLTLGFLPAGVLAAENTVTITYQPNGGTGSSIAETVRAGETKLAACTFAKEGCTFVGWSENANANAGGQYKSAVRAAGAVLNAEKNVTLYAIWADSAKTDAQFFIRLDGTIPTEPQSHPASEYTAAISLSGAIAGGMACFYTDSASGVGSRLAVQPTDAQIKAVYDPI